MLRHKVVKTDRLILRPLVAQDAQQIHALMTWEVARWLSSVPWPNTIEDAKIFAERACADNVAGKAAVYAIEHQGSFCGVIALEPRDGALNLSYWLGKSFWRKGLMSEAAQAFIETFFAINDVIHITSSAFANNYASLSLQKKLGFVVVSEMPVYSQSQQRFLLRFDSILGRRRYAQALVA